MRLFTAADLARVLDYSDLVARIALYFEGGCTQPVRHHHTLARAGRDDATLLLMPAWRLTAQGGGGACAPADEPAMLGVKVVSVFPDNGLRGLPAVAGSYLLIDGDSGRPLAVMDGGELTARRTAAASALASRFLSRPDSATLLIAGTGRLAPHLAAAHSAVRPIRRILIWGRAPDKAADVARHLADQGYAVEAVGDLREGVDNADIVSTATLARDPIIHGDWLRAGQHLDLVGGFRPTMREADDAALRRAEIYVDTREGACREAGDICDPLARKVIGEADIAADLGALCRGEHAGRTAREAITLFKSVGAALEDLAAAALAYRRLDREHLTLAGREL
ncbi:bifunctional Delta(1)-pyrroline-2-carboxylate/Delta(1)-piperideine-2-carboxylate reductase [Varunaivibrio sulfuroxidans]|uniref:Ornithine cyclodeaminase n=1 Tax=Varunaivibrio sulfuroxidans TaxID=1773489 RepID=A0A4V2UNE1_9PROT|nr:ornithine cyclodeaminase family protein [Varunaivibrio sulfuroxidans]TCS61631.1 ornithine cyclodeaminase [Varunaivibrio sulfuroxidans]WES29497.1 ornithine cyclodeaminase family protein [Varunaivibrio sulfuroxidans]